MKSVLFLSAALLLAGCGSAPQPLKTDVFYKRDLPMCVYGVGCFDGVAVVPARTSYSIEAAPKEEASIDLMIVNSCHREETFEKTASGWFIFKNKRRFRFDYTPIPALENDGLCTLRVTTVEKEKGRHAWGIIRFQHSDYRLSATNYCNGQVYTLDGISACQSKAGLTQRIRFSEPVMVEGDKDCPAMRKTADGSYEYEIKSGECGYTITNRLGEIHDLLTIGYEGVLVRNIE